jgi:biopolymer transport protein ExbD
MPLKTHLDEQPVLNLAPMIDIVFLLIIFFMVGATFARMERDIELEVPEVADAGALTDAPAHRVVNVYRNGRVTLDRQEVTLAQLTSELASAREQYDSLGVHVRGDAHAVHQRVAEVLHACKRAGIKELGISVKFQQGHR